MRLIAQGTLGHFHCTSEKDGDEFVYDVDILGHEGFGHCTCKDFTYRIQPYLDKGETPSHRCKHLIMARELFTDEVIKRTLQNMKAESARNADGG